MIFNNLNDKYLDFINEDSQTADDLNSQVFRIRPEGTNTLDSYKLFYQRKNYEKALNLRIEESNGNIKSFKDLIYSHSLYGKVNHAGIPVTLKADSLKLIPGSKNIFLCNAACDAFAELAAKHKTITDRKLISAKSKYFNITPVTGYDAPSIQYANFINFYFSEFVKELETSRSIDSILDVADLTKHFLNFFNSSRERSMFTKSQFMKSTLCSPDSSGLIVQFSKDDHGNDKNKSETYINDGSFVAFDNLVKEFGFVLDRHAPWRLIFDLSSPAAKKYISKYNILTVSDFFDKNYNIAEYSEFASLKNSLINLFNFISNKTPIVRKPLYRFLNSELKILNKELARKIILTESDLYKNISEVQLLDLYLYIKLTENNILRSEGMFSQEKSDINAIYQYQGVVEAITTILKKCNSNRDTGIPSFRSYSVLA